MIEFVDQEDRVLFERLVIDAGVGDVEIEDGGENVEHGNH